MNNLFQDLRYKVFQSGNPLYFYIGLNTIIFVVLALIGLPSFLAGNGGVVYDVYVREYAGFPALLSKLPYRFYTVFTYPFFHDGLLHLFFNMLVLYWMGQIFLDFLKPRQFHFVYLSGGVAGALVYLGAYNLFPVFAQVTASGAATIIGSSASVMAIVVAAATLVPDYSIRLLLFGDVKLKYLALVYVVLDLIGIASVNAGGSFAHLGGALLGFAYIKALQNGSDWSNLFKKKRHKLRVVKNDRKDGRRGKAGSGNTGAVNQEQIDAILDKISQSGYDKLSREEKETLFKASKHQE